MKIRPARQTDIPAITDLFNFYIANTNARFEEEPLTLEDRAQWFKGFQTNPKYRVIVAELEDKLIGFACSQQYRSLAAFADTVEVTIYLDRDAKGKGAGSMLYEELFSQLRAHGVHRALSGIALPNDASIALHEKFGFRKIGVFDQYAQKNGEYVSSIWLEKHL